jgi:hypothetical protein
MMRLICAMGLSGALIVSACSSSSGNKTTDSGAGGSGGSTASDAGGDTADAGPALVTVSGTAAPHPLAKALDPNATTNFTMINVAVVDPAIVIANPTAAPLQGGALDTSAGNCSSGTCAWSFDNVNISGISLGLVGILDDARTTGRLWVKTGTGAGSAATINMFKVSRAPITNVPLFAVSVATEGVLAMFAAGAVPDATIVPGTLTSRGFMIGSVVSKLSQGATPVAGAMVTTTDTRVNIIYPNADFSGVGTSTSATGTILVVPKPVAQPTSIVATWTVTAPSGDTRVWPSLTAGSTPGTAFVILFAANETP